MTEATKVWGYAFTRDADEWIGTYVSKQEAINAGRKEYGAECVFWVCSGLKQPPHSYLSPVSDIIDSMGENAFDQAGDSAMDWPPTKEGAEAELKALLWAWADKYFSPVSFWGAVGPAERIGESEGLLPLEGQTQLFVAAPLEDVCDEEGVE